MTLSIHVYIALSACHTQQSAFLSDTQLKTSSDERKIKNKTKQLFQEISSDSQLSVPPQHGTFIHSVIHPKVSSCQQSVIFSSYVVFQP